MRYPLCQWAIKVKSEIISFVLEDESADFVSYILVIFKVFVIL